MMPRPSGRGYAVRAAVHPYALVAMMMGVVVGMWTGIAIPLILMIHCLVVVFSSRSNAFRRLVDDDMLEAMRAEQAKETEQLIIQMELEHQNEFRTLMRQVEIIRDNATTRWNAVTQVAQNEEQLDTLLNTYLELGIAYKAGKDSLRSADRAALEEEIRALRQRPDGGETAALDERRLLIALRRAEAFDRTKEELQVMKQEMATVASLVHLMHEQSMKVTPPPGAGAQVDALLAELEGHSEALRELAAAGAANADVPVVTDKN